MFVVTCRVELTIPGAQSLKDKRRALRSAVERLRSRFNAAVSEVADQDVWQRATLGLAVVTLREHDGRDVVAQMLRQLEAQAGIEVRQAEVSVC